MRASLLFDEYGLGEHRATMTDRLVFGGFPPSMLERWRQIAHSPVAAVCVRRFAQIEGDTARAGLKGAGRVSKVAWPRLGGVLHADATRARLPASFFQDLVERTVLGAYLSTVLILVGEGPAAGEARPFDTTTLWERWIPVSYNASDELLEPVFSFSAVMGFWWTALRARGMVDVAEQVNAPESSLFRSLIGITSAGTMLAVVERG